MDTNYDIWTLGITQNKGDKMSINCIRTLIEDANASNPNKVALILEMKN